MKHDHCNALKDVLKKSKKQNDEREKNEICKNEKSRIKTNCGINLEGYESRK